MSFARQHKPERVAVQLNQILQDTLALRDYDLRLSNIRVHYHLAPDLPMTAADPHQLQQVFLNLVNNAVDAILEHANEGDLWVSTSAQGDNLIVEFKDSGPGVKDASRVFDPFYTTKPVGKGTGLGLSICYGIVTEHGGSISVANVEPSGACFTIKLPYQRAAEIADSIPRGAPAVRGARILLVDTDPSVREAVAAILLEGNHAVRAAADLAEAQRLLAEQEFDAIVADTEVRGAAGTEDLHDWLARNRPALAGRLVWMTAGATPVPPLRHNGNNGLPSLQKPFKGSDLLAAVELALTQVQPAVI